MDSTNEPQGTGGDATPSAASGAGSDAGIAPGRALMVIACVSTLVVNANTSAVSILLPSISVDLGVPIDVLQWAVTGYLLMGAATIVTSGALGDVFGRRRIFSAGLILFVASCVLIALAPNGLVVVLGRVIQGAAGAAILACGLSLLSAASSGRAQMRAVALWGGASAVGAAAGPVLGGVLNEVAGWQGLFWIDALIAAACIPATARLVTESSDPHRSHTIDWAGTALVAAILVPFVFAMSEGSTWGWVSWPTIVCLVITVAAGFGFVAVEGRVEAPLVNLRLLRNVPLVGSTLAILIGAGAIAAIMLLVSLYFQDPATFAMSSLVAGLATLPVAAGVVIVSPLVTPLAHHFGTRPVILTGFVVLTASFAALVFVGPSWGYGAFLLPMLGVAAGLGLSNGPASSISTACVSPDEVGAASGISNMARYVGGAVMTSVAAGIYAGISAHAATTGASAPEALASGFSGASLALAIFSASGIVLTVRVARRLGKPGALDLVAATASTTITLPATPAVAAATGGEPPGTTEPGPAPEVPRPRRAPSGSHRRRRAQPRS
jgi:MFS family permease